jgi:hypothetical protein
LLLRKPGDSRLIATVDRRDENSWNCIRCPRLSCADVAAANQSDVNGQKLREGNASFLVFDKVYEAPSDRPEKIASCIFDEAGSNFLVL